MQRWEAGPKVVLPENLATHASRTITDVAVSFRTETVTYDFLQLLVGGISHGPSPAECLQDTKLIFGGPTSLTRTSRARSYMGSPRFSFPVSSPSLPMKNDRGRSWLSGCCGWQCPRAWNKSREIAVTTDSRRLRGGMDISRMSCAQSLSA